MKKESLEMSLGTHYLIDLHNCLTLPETSEELQKIMEQAAKLVGATIVKSVFHEFNPFGLSGVIVIAESHFAIHIWPEYKIASLDLFSCKKINPEKGLYYIEKAFGSDDMRITCLERGFK